MPGKSGGGPPQSKTLARFPAATEFREASWTAPALWRFGSRTKFNTGEEGQALQWLD